MRAWFAVGGVMFLGLTAGCRIQRGGSGDDGLGDVLDAAPRAGGAGAPSSEPRQPAAAPAVSDVATAARDAGAPRSSTGAAVSDAGGGSQMGEPDLDAGSAAPTPGVSGEACGKAASIPGCNPITNEGCAGELGMQCDVDTTASSPSGVCVFSSPPRADGTCINIPPTESCPAGQTCVDFSACRKLCLCDADCGAGSRCSEPLAGTGFSTCQR